MTPDPTSNASPDRPASDQSHEGGGPLPNDLLAHIERLMLLDRHTDNLPDPGTTLGVLTREFFENNYAQARDGLLARTRLLRVEPQQSASPHVFRFAYDRPYKSKAMVANAPVELHDGPLCGTIRYRPDLFSAGPGEPCIGVHVDREHQLFHPNFSRSHGMLCIGDIPSGPFPLEVLLEHLYCVLTYQNISVSDPADAEAAAYFALDEHALDGLTTVLPLS